MDTDIQHDIAFVKSMISIHQQAIDMAKSQLAEIDAVYAAGGNTDESIEKFAKGVIQSYTQNIKVMTSWLTSNDAKSYIDLIWGK